MKLHLVITAYQMKGEGNLQEWIKNMKIAKRNM